MRALPVAVDHDPIFHGLLVSFTALVVPLYAAILLSPPVEVNHAEALDRASGLVVGVLRLPPPEAIVLPPVPSAVPKPAPPERAGPRVAAAAPGPQRPIARDPVVLAPIGTHGFGDPRVEEILALDDAQAARLERALAGITGAELASRAPPTLRGGGHERGADAVVAISSAAAGGVSTGEGRSVEVAAPSVDARAGEVRAEAGDAGDIARVLGGRRGAVESCAQAALKKDANTGGRVGVAWTIAQGRVLGAALTENSTGSAELGECVVRAVQRTRFDLTLTASVEEWVWVVSGR